jgi:hypothetical protein
MLPMQSGLKQGNALSPLLFKVASEHAIRKIQEKQVGLKLTRCRPIASYEALGF